MKDTRTCLKCRHKKSYLLFTQKRDGKEYFHTRCSPCLSKHYIKCHKCEHFRPYSKFHKSSAEKRGYNYSCKSCRKGILESNPSNFFQAHKDEIYAERRERNKIDPIYKVANNLRSRLSTAVRKRYWVKKSKFRNYIGCDLETLKMHLQSKFKPGMSWDNYSFKGWHIDHIIPLQSAKTIEELQKLCHYTNLQPLWAFENIAKRAK